MSFLEPSLGYNTWFARLNRRLEINIIEIRLGLHLKATLEGRKKTRGVCVRAWARDTHTHTLIQAVKERERA